jgi:hypothetical protein
MTGIAGIAAKSARPVAAIQAAHLFVIGSPPSSQIATANGNRLERLCDWDRWAL